MCAGDYAGFDEKEPTSKNGGKAEVISMLKKKYGYTKLFMIGDGITDLEACPPADAFIGKLDIVNNVHIVIVSYGLPTRTRAKIRLPVICCKFDDGTFRVCGGILLTAHVTLARGATQDVQRSRPTESRVVYGTPAPC